MEREHMTDRMKQLMEADKENRVIILPAMEGIKEKLCSFCSIMEAIVGDCNSGHCKEAYIDNGKDTGKEYEPKIGDRVKVADGIGVEYAGKSGTVVTYNIQYGWIAVKVDDTGECWALPNLLVEYIGDN